MRKLSFCTVRPADGETSQKSKLKAFGRPTRFVVGDTRFSSRPPLDQIIEVALRATARGARRPPKRSAIRPPDQNCEEPNPMSAAGAEPSGQVTVRSGKRVAEHRPKKAAMHDPARAAGQIAYVRRRSDAKNRRDAPLDRAGRRSNLSRTMEMTKRRSGMVRSGWPPRTMRPDERAL